MTSTTPDANGRRWKRYAEYRPISHPWLAAAPETWAVRKISWLFGSTGSGTTPSTSDDSYFGEGIPWVNTGDLNDSVIHEIHKSITEKAVRDHSALKLYPAGTLLIALYGATIGKLGILPNSAATNQACFAMADAVGVDVRYVLYWLLASRERIIALSYGGGQPNISGELVRNLRVTVPPLQEQRAIAAFLDRETARIDELIGHKERLIALLEEKRQAVISHAVTRGLDAAAPLKDSGVPWIGVVPKHWEVSRVKFVARLESGHTPSRQHPEYWENCTIPWFTLSDVRQLRGGWREYVSDTEEKVSQLGIANSGARLLPAGTVIVSRTASVGFSGILAVPMATSQDYVNWVCGEKIQPEYLLYVFRGMRHEFRRLVMGSTHQTIYMPDVNGFQTPVPPLDEQKRIVTSIRSANECIKTLTTRIRDGIARLQEYRTALISAAVTGQIDVRGEVD